VVYSGTKHMDGQGRILGGAVLANQQFIDDAGTGIMKPTPSQGGTARRDHMRRLR
jgi:O-succinylhomoserine sulfhydrylase